MTVEEISEVCHEAIRAFQSANRETPIINSWRAAQAHQQDSTRQSVRFLLDNPGAQENALHEKWMEGKKAAGYNYGTVKDDDLLTHPSLIPFEQLPLLQQKKDRLFIAVVNALK